jgi:heat shock protein HslJ
MTWYLVTIRDANGTVPVLPGTQITAFFDGRGNVTGVTGCNEYTAPYSGGDNLTVGQPITTKKACESPIGVTEQETRYLERIQSVSSYTVAENLTLRDARGATILVYSPVANGTLMPAPFAETSWYVYSLVDATGKTHSPRGLTTLRLVFGRDGHLYGNAGCNNLYGSYRQSGENAIAISDLKTTRIYCGIGGVMELESAFLSVLPKITRYSVEGDTLRLTDTEGTATIDCETTSPS